MHEVEKKTKINFKHKVKVEKNVMGVLKEIGNCLDEEYKKVIMEFEATKEEVEMEDGMKKKSKKKIITKKNVNVTIVKNSKEFAKKAIEARSLNEEKVKIRVVVDSG